MTIDADQDPQVYWTAVGADYNGTDEQREIIQREIERMHWKALPQPLPMMPALALHKLASSFGVHSARMVSHNGSLGPMGLLGIEKHYGNGAARIYAVDDGVSVTPVRSDFWPKPRVA